MASTVIMTDSIACIPPELAKEHGIEVVPASNIMFGGKTYLEGVTITAKECYEFIKKDPDSFMTSAITPGFLVDEFRKAAEVSPNIIHITLSSAMSAGFQTANLAVETLRKESPGINIRVVDSKTVGGAQALIVMAVAREARNGTNLDGLVALAQKARQKTGGIMFLDTLRYIYRTGRMSKTKARLVSMLNIKPINRIADDGTAELVDKVRKRSDGYKKVIEIIRKDAGTDALHFVVSHADAPDLAAIMADQLKQEFKCLSMVTSDYSPVMGFGAGPGGLFIGYQPELK